MKNVYTFFAMMDFELKRRHVGIIVKRIHEKKIVLTNVSYYIY